MHCCKPPENFANSAAKPIRRMKLLAHRFWFLCPWLWLTEPKKTAFYDAGTIK